ncbi:TIGR00266 family protein [Patulibacter sp.]|uniref:TIGR00266 family protein n=1 Tax=Patulibacter sp. TaxID=1912859 RepID=UPI00272425F7|nr:TIGR00266 family protein [Patulibacter sp.]MDO9408221.1 TIGR00266 family protein [Patulibacter sp.]
MDVTVRNAPSFAVARLTLAPGESLNAESGAMMATSGGVEVESKMRGGLKGAFKRSVLGGESVFVSKFTAPSEGGWVDVAAKLPGDVATLPVDGGLNLARGGYLAADEGVEIDSKWGGLKNLAGGEGGFLVRVEGRGQVVLAAYGAIDVVELQAGESFVLDSGHMVAYEDGVEFSIRKVAKGMVQSLKSGEGLVFEFQGPGRVWTQSRNPGEFLGWLTAELPFSRG